MYEDKGLLKRFMQEFFPFGEFRKAGIFTKEMKGDFEAQAAVICRYFSFKTVYEYGALEEPIRCHLSEANPQGPFVTEIRSIYD